MAANEVFFYSNASLMLIFNLTAPVVGVATVVGLLVAMLQTLIQLQEQTLGFGVKLTAIVVVLLTSGSWMASELMTFTDQIYDRIGRGG